jgi:hypothetical protein
MMYAAKSCFVQDFGYSQVHFVQSFVSKGITQFRSSRILTKSASAVYTYSHARSSLVPEHDTALPMLHIGIC